MVCDNFILIPSYPDNPPHFPDTGPALVAAAEHSEQGSSLTPPQRGEVEDGVLEVVGSLLRDKLDLKRELVLTGLQRRGEDEDRRCWVLLLQLLLLLLLLLLFQE